MPSVVPPSTWSNRIMGARQCHYIERRLTLPSRGRSKGRFAPFGPPLMSNVRPHEQPSREKERMSLNVARFAFLLLLGLLVGTMFGIWAGFNPLGLSVTA